MLCAKVVINAEPNISAKNFNNTDSLSREEKSPDTTFKKKKMSKKVNKEQDKPIHNLKPAIYTPDILGDDFVKTTIKMQPDYEGDVVITIVKKDFNTDSKRAILYIHGYNDYFFQKEAANRSAELGYRFYALDLRKYGRSYMHNQYPFQVKDLEEYFEDIDSTLVLMKSEGCEEINLMAHSTGGLISSLYCHKNRKNLKLNSLILNSPFLDMNLSKFNEKVGVPLLSFLGFMMPNTAINMGTNSAYAESLHKNYKGEWKFNTKMKYPMAPKITIGWIRAIHKGQKKLQKGLEIPCPILLMYSDKSIYGDEWSPKFQKGDAVLDVSDIAFYGKILGNNVADYEIRDGMHDLLLSSKRVRNRVYKIIFSFLAEIDTISEK